MEFEGDVASWFKGDFAAFERVERVLFTASAFVVVGVVL